MEIKENYSLKKLNTFGFDVYTAKLVRIYSEEDIYTFITQYRIEKENILILGSGSNILFTKDFDGIIIQSEMKDIFETKRDENHVWLNIGSGVIWDDLVKYCVERGYGGIENLSLIPGTVGAAPIQNIGAYGVEFKQVFEELEGIDLITSEKKLFNKLECKFDYRDSIFKRSYKNRFIITKVKLKLSLVPKLKVNYRAINDYIKENKIGHLNIKVVSEIIRNIRNSKLPKTEEIGNAGSFFKNPIINKDAFEKLKAENVDLVFFKIDENTYKIPAGWLIEKAGYKGKKIGKVGVHSKQALVLVNYGEGKGSEIIKLSSEIKEHIREKFNINLEIEVNIV